MSDDRLRALYDQALVGRAGATAHSVHPSPEELHALARRELPERRQLELLDHVMACATCVPEFELLRAVEGAGATLDGAARRPRASTPQRAIAWRRAVPMLLAASAVAAVGIGAYDRLRPGADVARGEPGVLSTLAPVDGAVVGLPVRLTWRRVPGASRYVVEVLDASGIAAFTATTGDTTVLVPSTAPLTRGAAYEWWVRTEGGGAQERSALSGFRRRVE